MRIKKLLMIICLVASATGAFAQLRYPIVGTYKKASMQGLAIHDDYAYLINDGGLCRVYDLKEQQVVGEFMLGSADKDNHANCVCFGSEFPDGNTTNPAIYISQFRSPYRCFVESISKDTAQVIQTIHAEENGKVVNVSDWVVDPDNQLLYTISYGKKKEDVGSNTYIISKFRLPKLAEGKEIVFTEKDILDRFTAVFPNVLQGAKIKNGRLYIVTGFGESASSRQDAQRAIKVINLKEKRLMSNVDLTYLTTNEPEDMDFYKGKALLMCGQEGGLWEVKLH